MFESFYNASMRVLSGLAIAFRNIFEFLFEDTLADLLLSYINVNNNGLLDWIITNTISNFPFLADNTIGSLLLGSAILSIIGFSIMRAFIELIR